MARTPASFVASLASLALAAGAMACGERHTAPDVARPTAPSASAASRSPAGSTAAAPPPEDAGPYDGPWLGATVLQAPILSEMDWPGDKKADPGVRSIRLGYMRYGERTPVIPEAHKKSNCPDGWYELVSGGFVCGKFATLDMDHPRFKLAKPPDLEGPLPYTYGINVANGTPLYRQVPSRQERLKLEPWLVGRPKRPRFDDDNPYAPASSTTLPDTGDPDAGADIPWWEKESPDGGPPTITLEDLQENGGPIARRMVKGFFLSLDHEFEAAGTKWWKTVANMSAPFDRILLAKPLTDLHGVWLGKDDATFATKDVPARRIDKLPVGFVLHGSKRWVLDANHKQATIAPTGGPINRFSAVGLTGEKARVGGIEYWETDEGWWLRSIDGTKTEPGPPPDKLGEHDKWIDVNLKRQTLVAFEGTTPVFATIFSSGRNEHETTPGSFRIREKHIAATMDGDAELAADGPYSIEDVPYIQYFNGSYALHGAFWHAAFGSVKSHGCVNLAPWDAKALFGWTDPQLPEGWHAAFATKENPGTRVVVHDRGPGTCEGPEAQPPQCPVGGRY
jgi:L,D-transpeptidase-like protein